MDISTEHFEFLAGMSLTFPESTFSVESFEDGDILVQIGSRVEWFKRSELVANMQKEIADNPLMADQLSETIKGVNLNGTLADFRND